MPLIASIDVGWAEGGMRGAVALVNERGDIEALQAKLSDDDVLGLLRSHAATIHAVLLDIPIRGCNTLNEESFRPIDKALQKQGIPLLPSTKAGMRGADLERRIKQALAPSIAVWEMYPYQIWKVLWFLRSRKALGGLAGNERKALLDDSFRTCWPPKYKRERNKTKRTNNLRQLHDLLTSRKLGLQFATPLPAPGTEREHHLTDLYDATLGAVLGSLLLRGSPYAVRVGDTQNGDLLLIADRWLVRHIEDSSP